MLLKDSDIDTVHNRAHLLLNPIFRKATLIHTYIIFEFFYQMSLLKHIFVNSIHEMYSTHLKLFPWKPCSSILWEPFSSSKWNSEIEMQCTILKFNTFFISTFLSVFHPLPCKRFLRKQLLTRFDSFTCAQAVRFSPSMPNLRSRDLAVVGVPCKHTSST